MLLSAQEFRDAQKRFAGYGQAAKPLTGSIAAGSFPPINSQSFKYGNAAVAARVGCALQRAIRSADDRAGMARRLVEILQHLDLVAALSQRLGHFRAETRFEFRCRRGRPPGAPEQPARRTDCLLQALAVDVRG